MIPGMFNLEKLPVPPLKTFPSATLHVGCIFTNQSIHEPLVKVLTVAASRFEGDDWSIVQLQKDNFLESASRPPCSSNALQTSSNFFQAVLLSADRSSSNVAVNHAGAVSREGLDGKD